MAIQAVAPSEPMGVGRLLDQAVRLYRGSFLTFVGIIAVVQVPLVALQLLISMLTFGPAMDAALDPSADSLDSVFGPGFMTGIGATALVGLATFVLLQGVATAALTRAIADRYMGNSPGILEAYRRVGGAWLRLLGALFLLGLISIGLLIWLIIPCIGWFTGPGMLAFTILALLPLLAPIVVVEGATATQAIRRAWDLARRRFWWLMGFFLALLVFAQVIITGPTTLLILVFQLIVGDPFATNQSTFAIQTVVQSVSGLALSLVYLPLQLTAVTLVYFDTRVRTEGFDLAVLARGESGQSSDVAAVASAAPKAAAQRLITGRELLNFALLSLGAVVIYFVFLGIGMLLGILMMGSSGGF